MREGATKGFTLLELTVVMAIISIILAMAVGAHYAWKRYAALDAAQTRTVAVLDLARQQAIASSNPALFVFGNGHVPYEDETFRTALDLSIGLTNVASGWCCVLALTNIVDETDALECLESETQTTWPIVGDVVLFAEPILWGDRNEFDDEEEQRSRYLLFLPDGSLAEEHTDSNRTEPFASPTNVLWGAVDQTLGERKAAQSRILCIQPRSGAARALSSEEREIFFQ